MFKLIFKKIKACLIKVLKSGTEFENCHLLQIVGGFI